MNNDLIRRSKAIEELNYLKHIGYDNSGVMKLQNMEIQRCISVIEDVPAEDISGSEYFPYRKAYLNGVAGGAGALAEKLKDRIEESVCKYCQMNKHCELCEISRVFSIITLTAEEQKGGAK